MRLIKAFKKVKASEQNVNMEVVFNIDASGDDEIIDIMNSIKEVLEEKGFSEIYG